MMQTYESGQPWVVYTYLTPDSEIPPEGGTTRIAVQCSICGAREDIPLSVPPIGQEPVLPSGYKHPERVRFLNEHVHEGQQHAPETWAMPFLNVEALMRPLRKENAPG